MQLPAHDSLLDEKLSKSSPGKWGAIVFGIMLLGGLLYIGSSLGKDLAVVHSASVFPYILLGVALLIALGFEFVNGFHDTANAVATCIYTHSLEPHIAVVYSGIMNFLGVLANWQRVPKPENFYAGMNMAQLGFRRSRRGR